MAGCIPSHVPGSFWREGIDDRKSSTPPLPPQHEVTLPPLSSPAASDSIAAPCNRKPSRMGSLETSSEAAAAAAAASANHPTANAAFQVTTISDRIDIRLVDENVTAKRTVHTVHTVCTRHRVRCHEYAAAVRFNRLAGYFSTNGCRLLSSFVCRSETINPCSFMSVHAKHQFTYPPVV